VVTCIVGVEQDGRVYIGGDSAGVAGYSLTIRADTKVFRVGPYIMGFTTSFRMGQLLRYRLEVGQPTGWDVDRFMATTFVDAVRACLSDGGFLRSDSGVEQGGSFLVGIQGRLYAVHSDFQIAKSLTGYDAVGCGEELALGSLHGTSELDPKSRVLKALAAAEAHSAGVSGPFVVDDA
jgi:hypothetical protein